MKSIGRWYRGTFFKASLYQGIDDAIVQWIRRATFGLIEDTLFRSNPGGEDPAGAADRLFIHRSVNILLEHGKNCEFRRRVEA
jgi:hypothetical protein